MQMTYVPEIKGIIQDSTTREIVAKMTAEPLEGISIHVLAKAMAIAPRLVCVLDHIMDIEPDDHGDRTLSTEGMEPIREVLSAFTMADFIALTHYVHIVK